MVLQPQQQQQIGGIPTTAFAGSAGDEDGDVQLFDEQLLTDPVSAARITNTTGRGLPTFGRGPMFPTTTRNNNGQS